jgi:hypothetical protein
MSIDRIGFHPNFFTLYTAQLFVYLLPVLLFRWRALLRDSWRAGAAVLLSWIYWLAPVRACKAVMATLAPGVRPTVGFFQTALQKVLRRDALVDLALFVCFGLGMLVAAFILQDCWLRIRARRCDFELFLDLAILLFLLLMPFSYYSWEKYFMPIIPFVILRVLLVPGINTVRAGLADPTPAEEPSRSAKPAIDRNKLGRESA